MKKKLGQQETQLLAYLQLRKQRTVRTGDLTGPLQISRDQERELFRRMSRGGLIARVRPGLYLVPALLPLGGLWSPDEILALNTLMEDSKAKYQICGLNAFNRYGFDEQVPNRTYAYNNRNSGDRKIGSVALTLIEVADKRLGNTEMVQTAEGLKAVYSSRARALLDAVYDWSRFNSLPRAYEWIRKELKVKAGDAGGAGFRHAEVRRHRDDPADGRAAGARGRGESVVKEARKGIAEDFQPDPLDTHQS